MRSTSRSHAPRVGKTTVLIVALCAAMAWAGGSLLAGRPVDLGDAGGAAVGAQDAPQDDTKFAPTRTVSDAASAAASSSGTRTGSGSRTTTGSLTAAEKDEAASGINDNGGATGTSNFTQSETTLVAFGSRVVVGFNDSGSNAGGTNKFTGWAYSSDGGVTFTDGGTLPTSANGDAGDPVMARHDVTGRIYFSTLSFSGGGTIQMWRSDDNGLTWMAPVNGTPGGSSEDKQWHTVDNFAGPGNGNVYLMSRRFGTGPGIYFFRSTDGGATFGPTGGLLIASSGQGSFVAVGADHSVYAFWYAGTTIQVRKSTDQGLTFGPPATVASGLVGGTNGDLGLTGTRNGTATAAAFRSNEFPHVAVNPITGNIYVTYNNDGPGADKADVLLVQSTDGGATWSAPVRVNDDATTTDQWMPTIAVSTDGTRLGVFYYSRQEDPANNNLFKYYGRLAVLSGGLTTFTPSFAISTVASLPEFGRDSVVNTVYMGDYNHAVATPGAFHVSWSDNRDDLAIGPPRKDPNVYYARIPLGMAVTSTVPAAGSIVGAPPTVFTVNVTDAVNPATLQASDFQVNGIPASSVAYTAGTTSMTFTYAVSPVVNQGLQTMHVDAGAFTRASDGDPVLVFDATFAYDALPLQVVSTTPPFPGGVFTLPSPLTLDVTFNEPINPASVQTSDLVVGGIPGSSVTAAMVLAGNTTARFTLSVPSEGTLGVTIAAGAVSDAFGNPNLAFATSYVVDIGTVPYPVPLSAKNPPGSLVYDPSASGSIAPSGDMDSFTIAIDPGQTVSVLVTAGAGLQPSVQLRDPSNAVIASATAAGAGQNALLQTVPATAGGTYTVDVSGAGGTTGAYVLQLVLNAAIEVEGVLAGVTNDTPPDAQNIDGSFLALPGGATRGAVLGTTDNAGYSAAAVPFAFDDISGTGTLIAGLTNQDDASVSIPIGFSFPFYGTGNTAVFVSSNGLMTFGAANTTFTNADLTTSPPQAAIAPFWDDQHTAGGQAGSNVFFQVLGSGASLRLVVQWNQVRFFSGGTAGDTLTYQAQLYADGRIQLNYADLVSGTAAGNNGASATVGVKAAGTQGVNRLLLAFNNGPNAFVGTGQSTLISPPNPMPDVYAFTASAGDTVTAVLEGLTSSNVDVALLDSVGNTIATGVAGATNYDKGINNFVLGAAGTYYARVTGTVANASYSLVLGRNTAFDTEANDSFAAAQPVAGNRGALGAMVPANVYSGNAVPFEFEDISGTGTIIVGLTGADDAAVSIPIGFAFPFYGTSNASVFVSSNGLLTFGAANTAFTNADLTASPAQASIAPFWDDLIVSGSGASNVLYQVTGSGSSLHVTIQWNQVSFFSGGTGGDTITFQAQLYADGRILFNFQDLVSGTAAGNNGGSATVGIKAAGTQGPDRLLLAFNNGPNAFVGSGQSTLISSPPSDDWYTVTVTGSSLAVTTSTPADGPGEFVNVLDPHVELYSPANVLVASGVTGGDGRNETISLAGLSPGDYRIRMTSQGGTTGEYFVSASAGTPPISAAGQALSAESCVPANGLIDAAERATVSLSLRNDLTTPTVNLVATLLSTGGVTSPTAPQSYGALAPGATAARTFSFTADPSLTAGQQITPTLQLQDGATSLGTASYLFTVGPLTTCGTVRLVTSSQLTRLNATTVRATVTVQNTGTITANNVSIVSAKLGATNTSTALPQNLGSLAGGASASRNFDFTVATSGASVLSIGGTYSGGSFGSSQKVVVP